MKNYILTSYGKVTIKKLYIIITVVIIVMIYSVKF